LFLMAGLDDFELCLLPEQKASLEKDLEAIQKEIGSFLVALPGDEEMYGGCLAAGRGFLHVSSDGRLEACPFAPYSDVSLKNMSLEDALRSPLMRKIRENHGMLTESRGGCALWENREWVEQVQKEASK